jgi:hypothetical protein
MDGLISDLVETRRVLVTLDRRLAEMILRLTPPTPDPLPADCIDAEVAHMLPPQPMTIGDEV